MGLIDLDQTIIFTITDETQGGMQYEVQMTIAEVFDKFFDGVQPAIVDAIPVEWLEWLMLSTGDDVDKVEFAWIMREWLGVEPKGDA